MVCHVIVGRPDRSVLLLLTAAIITQHIALLQCSAVPMLLDASYLGDLESKTATSRTVLLATVRSIKSDRILVEANRVLTSKSTFPLHKESRNLTSAGKMYTIVFIRAPQSLPQQQQLNWYPLVNTQYVFFVQSANNPSSKIPRLFTQYVPEQANGAIKRLDRLFGKRGVQVRAANITGLAAKMQSQQGKSKLIVTCTVKSLLNAVVSWSVHSSDSSVSLPQPAQENISTTRQKSHLVSRLELSDDLLNRGPLNITCFARNVLGQHQWSTSFEESHFNVQSATTSTSTTTTPTTTTSTTTTSTTVTTTTSRTAVSNSVCAKTRKSSLLRKNKKQQTTAAVQPSPDTTTSSRLSSTTTAPTTTTVPATESTSLPSYCKSSCWEAGTRSCEMTGVAGGHTVTCICRNNYEGTRCHLYKPRKRKPMKRALRSALWQSEPVELETDMHEWNETDTEVIDYSDQLPTPANQHASDDMSAISDSLQRSEGESEAETQQETSAAQSSVNCRVFFRFSSCGNRPVDSTAGRSSRVLPSTAKRRDDE